jgi:hypothetical protein
MDVGTDSTVPIVELCALALGWPQIILKNLPHLGNEDRQLFDNSQIRKVNFIFFTRIYFRGY